MSDKKASLNNILNSSLTVEGVAYSNTPKVKLNKLKDLANSLKEYSEYFKLINTFKLIKKAFKSCEKNKIIDEEFIKSVIDFIDKFRKNRFILDSSQKSNVQDIYNTLYEIIKTEILYSNPHKSDILEEIIKDEYDAIQMNELIISEIEETRKSTCLDIDTFNSLENYIVFLHSIGVTNLVRIELIIRLLACTNNIEFKEIIESNLKSIKTKMDINEVNLKEVNFSAAMSLDAFKESEEKKKTKKKLKD